LHKKILVNRKKLQFLFINILKGFDNIKYIVVIKIIGLFFKRFEN